MLPVPKLVALTGCTSAEAQEEHSYHAAILEFCAHMPRAEAERLAVEHAVPYLAGLGKERT